jgi:16S rRNA (guanine1516-N2)-methyltransferase
MSLNIIGLAPEEFRQQLLELEKIYHHQDLAVTLEWSRGQFWLYSDNPQERPIGIHLDQELERHQQYFKSHSVVKELLARAIGIRPGLRPKVVDLTGGLLGDTQLFLSFGCSVVTVERHPIIALLIKSAKEKAQHSALSRWQFIQSDALSFLSAEQSFEVIYFDPMFDDVNDKALPKKEMRIFRGFVGSDDDALKVFQCAYDKKPKRLVVKRPRLSKSLWEKPDIIFEGKATRYDVYLPQNHGTFGLNPVK